jgi:hypothetical protein
VGSCGGLDFVGGSEPNNFFELRTSPYISELLQASSEVHHQSSGQTGGLIRLNSKSSSVFVCVVALSTPPVSPRVIIRSPPHVTHTHTHTQQTTDRQQLSPPRLDSRLDSSSHTHTARMIMLRPACTSSHHRAHASLHHGPRIHRVRPRCTPATRSNAACPSTWRLLFTRSSSRQTRQAHQECFCSKAVGVSQSFADTPSMQR